VAGGCASGTLTGGPASTLATFCPRNSVNQRLPSGPAAMPCGALVAVGTRYSVKTPAVVTRAALFPLFSVNQRFPSCPAAMPCGLLLAVGTGYSVKTPERVTLAT